jgi:hypothetical protein
LDENISPGVAFPADYVPEPDELAGSSSSSSSDNQKSEVERSFAPAFLSLGREGGGRRKPVFIGAIAVAILASVAVIGVPAGWYKSSPAPAAAAESTATAPAPQNAQAETPAQPQPAEANAGAASGEDPEAAARRQREKERRAREAAARNTETAGATTPAPTTDAPKPGAKRVVVSVTYDESGRVTQASGGDANALRIARQKRFPPGKAGSATITIPIN